MQPAAMSPEAATAMAAYLQRRTAPPAAAPPAVHRFRLSLVREATEDYPKAVDGEPDALGMANPEACARFLLKLLGDEPAEAMAALYLDVRNRLIGYSVVYRGTLARAACEPRGIFVPGLLCNAAGLILSHNHPSGDPSPSAEDLAFTRRCAEAGEILGIRVLDHIVIGDAGRWVSLSRRGGW